MELRVLEYFLTVAREENITRAAEVLHITQPTLSRQLTELEAELGTPLLIRGKKRTELTEEGLLLRRRAEELLELSEKTKREINSAHNEISGMVSIGAAECSAVRALPELMQRFCPQYPKVRFELLSGNADQIKERLDNGLLDVGLLVEPINLGKYEYVHLPYPDRWGVLMRSDDPLAKKEHITVEDLRPLPVLISGRSMLQGEFVEYFGSQNWWQTLNIFSTYNLISNAAELVAHGLGYAVCIDGAVRHYGPTQFCFRPLFPELTIDAVLIWQKWQRFSPAATKFIEEVKMLFGHN